MVELFSYYDFRVGPDGRLDGHRVFSSDSTDSTPSPARRETPPEKRQPPVPRTPTNPSGPKQT